MKGNPISTFPPCFSFHIGEVILIGLARLMGSLRNISPRELGRRNVSHKKEEDVCGFIYHVVAYNKKPCDFKLGK